MKLKDNVTVEQLKELGFEKDIFEKHIHKNYYDARICGSGKYIVCIEIDFEIKEIIFIVDPYFAEEFEIPNILIDMFELGYIERD